MHMVFIEKGNSSTGKVGLRVRGKVEEEVEGRISNTKDL